MMTVQASRTVGKLDLREDGVGEDPVGEHKAKEGSWGRVMPHPKVPPT